MISLSCLKDMIRYRHLVTFSFAASNPEVVNILIAIIVTSIQYEFLKKVFLSFTIFQMILLNFSISFFMLNLMASSKICGWFTHALKYGIDGHPRLFILKCFLQLSDLIIYSIFTNFIPTSPGFNFVPQVFFYLMKPLHCLKFHYNHKNHNSNIAKKLPNYSSLSILDTRVHLVIVID